MVLLVGVVFMYFYNNGHLYRRRIEILELLNRSMRSKRTNSSNLVEELRETDLLIFGGCKQDAIKDCGECFITVCPKHSMHNAYYEHLENLPDPPDIFQSVRFDLIRLS